MITARLVGCCVLTVVVVGCARSVPAPLQSHIPPASVAAAANSEPAVADASGSSASRLASNPAAASTRATSAKVTPGPSPYVVNSSRYAAALANDGGGSLYDLVRRGPQWNDGPGAWFVGLDTTSVYISGALTNSAGKRVTVQRLDRATLTVKASASLRDLTSVARSASALWFSTGHDVHISSCSCTPPPQRHTLLALDPATLAVMRSFELPQPPLLVAATPASPIVWVAAPDHLLRVDPGNGAVIRSVPLLGYPIALSMSDDGRRLYVSSLTSKPQRGILSDVDTSNGALLGRYTGDFISDAPPAVTPDGIWVNEQHPVNGDGNTTFQLLTGDALHPGPTMPGFNFNTTPYVVGQRLWLLDRNSETPTTCADLHTGRRLGTGPPIGRSSGPTAISDKQGTYLLRTSGLSQDLVAVHPKTC